MATRPTPTIIDKRMVTPFERPVLRQRPTIAFFAAHTPAAQAAIAVESAI
jgi:hypothetical protein